LGLCLGDSEHTNHAEGILLHACKMTFQEIFSSCCYPKYVEHEIQFLFLCHQSLSHRFIRRVEYKYQSSRFIDPTLRMYVHTYMFSLRLYLPLIRNQFSRLSNQAVSLNVLLHDYCTLAWFKVPNSTGMIYKPLGRLAFKTAFSTKFLEIYDLFFACPYMSIHLLDHHVDFFNPVTD
jgi:hypothetical protein